MSQAKTYSGGCQCGRVQYQVTAAIDSLMECNCSMCSRKGVLMTFVPKTQFKLLKGDGAMSTHLFNKRIIQHLFCSTCGIHSFAEGKMPDGTAMIAVNARCLEDFDVGSVPIKKVDGKNF